MLIKPAIFGLVVALVSAAPISMALSGELAADVGTTPSSVETAIEAADELISEGNHEQAINQLEEVLARTPSEDRVDQALLHSRLAVGHYYRRDVEAIRFHAEAAIERVADDPNALDVYADALSAQALYLGESGQTAAYLEASKAELAVRRQLPPAESRLSIPLVNIAIAYGESGDFQSAQHYLREALTYALEYEGDTHQPTLIRSNLAWVYGMRKEYNAAARVLRDVVEAARQNQPGSIIFAMRSANLGSVLVSLERYSEAEALLEEARVIQSERIPGSLDLARTSYALAQVSEARGQKERAERLHREAIEIIDQQSPESPGSAFPRRALAGLMIDQSRYDEAHVLLDQAVSLTGLTNNPGQHASTLFQIGRLALARGDLDGARARWYQAIEALETQYDQLGGSSLTLASFSQAYEPLYRKLSQLLIDSGEFIEAIRLLESYRNRALLERIDIDRILRRSEVGQALLSDLSELRRQARSLVGTTAESDGTESDPHARLAELRRQRLDRVAAAIQVQPGLDRLFEFRPQWELADLGLDPGARLLYYSLGTDRSDLLVVGPEGIRAHRVPPIAEISTLVERFRILVQRPDADPAPLEAVSRRLHEVLIAPAQVELDDVHSLKIRADGPLLLLPFAALQDGSDAYLVEHFSLQRLHTLGDRHALEARAAPIAYAYAGFAYAGDDESSSSLRAPKGRLRHVDEEVKFASNQFGAAAESYTGTDATESRARSIDGRRIVHFASHAVANPIEPLSSYIALAADEQHDGLFELWEVMTDLSLEGGLVMLSGCETALGPSFAGEGLFGLAKGFAYAGAESVIASLWAVDDASTLNLTQAFYRELAAGRSQAEALTLAQRAILSGEMPAASWWQRMFRIGPEHRYSHPYYWAAMTLTLTR